MLPYTMLTAPSDHIRRLPQVFDISQIEKAKLRKFVTSSCFVDVVVVVVGGGGGGVAIADAVVVMYKIVLFSTLTQKICKVSF